MPFTKVGTNDYTSPSGRHFNLNQVRLWYSQGGKFPGQKGPGEAPNPKKNLMPKKAKSPAKIKTPVRAGVQKVSYKTPAAMMLGLDKTSRLLG